MNKQAEIERFRQMRLQEEMQQFNQHQYEQQARKQHQQQQYSNGQSELQQSESDVNLDESVLNTQQMGHKAVQKLQS